MIASVLLSSGGEQRRVSFAVSLIQEPPLLILDEPTVGMDSLLRQRCVRTCVCVNHLWYQSSIVVFGSTLEN